MKKFTKQDRERLFKNKFRTLVGVVLRAQTVADEARDIANGFMDEKEVSDSDICRVMENLSVACEEVLELYYNQINR